MKVKKAQQDDTKTIAGRVPVEFEEKLRRLCDRNRNKNWNISWIVGVSVEQWYKRNHGKHHG